MNRKEFRSTHFDALAAMVVAILLTLVSPVVGQNLLQNPDFEQPPHDGSGTPPTITGWTNYQLVGPGYFDGSFSSVPDGLPACEGTYFASKSSSGLTGRGGLWQRFNTTSGQTYHCSIWLNTFDPLTPHSPRVRIGWDPTGGTNPAGPSVQWSHLGATWEYSQGSWKRLWRSWVASSGLATFFVEYYFPYTRVQLVQIDQCRVAAYAESLVLSGIRAEKIDDVTFRISWTSSGPAYGKVEYGPTTQYGLVVAESGGTKTSHSVVLSNLSPSTLYHYRVTSWGDGYQSGVSGDQTFSTTMPTFLRNAQFEDGVVRSLPANIAENGDLEAPYYDAPDTQHQIPDKWEPLILSGTPVHGPDSAVRKSGNVSLAFNGSAFSAAIYQRRPGAITGRSYSATAYVRGSDSNQYFWVGIDPNGGTDPMSPSISWSMALSPGAAWTLMPAATTTAATNAVTVFVKILSTSATDKSTWIDAVSLGGCTPDSTVPGWQTPAGYPGYELFGEGYSAAGCPLQNWSVPSHSGNWIGAVSNYGVSNAVTYQRFGTAPGSVISCYAWVYASGAGAVNSNPSSPYYNCLVQSPNRFGETTMSIGIDPTGGTDPTAATVRWSARRQTQDWEAYWAEHSALPCPLPPDHRFDAAAADWQKIGTCAIAAGSVATVFLKADHFPNLGWNICGADDVTLEPPTVCHSVGSARMLMNDTNIELVGDQANDVVVTGVVNDPLGGDYFIVEDSNRSGAIRVVGWPPGQIPAVGHKVRIVGSITHGSLINPSPAVNRAYDQQLRLAKPAGIRVIKAIIVEDLGTGRMPTPIGLTLSEMVGGSGASKPRVPPSDPEFPAYEYWCMRTNAGDAAGVGLNNVDKLATVAGRVLLAGYDSNADQYYVVIDDGSHPIWRAGDYEGIGPINGWGIKILTGDHDYGEYGDDCVASPPQSLMPDFDDPCWRMNCYAIVTGFVSTELVMDWDDPDVARAKSAPADGKERLGLPTQVGWPKATMNLPGFRVRMINGEPDIVML